MPCSTVSFRMTLSDLAKYSMTRSIVRQQSYMLQVPAPGVGWMYWMVTLFQCTLLLQQ